MGLTAPYGARCLTGKPGVFTPHAETLHVHSSGAFGAFWTLQTRSWGATPVVLMHLLLALGADGKTDIVTFNDLPSRS